jgi:hypothetical protein
MPDTDLTPPLAVVARRGGVPSDAELAAIVAAIEVTWPHPVAVPTAELPRWRFSGRWWTKPVPLRRVRPWAR